MSFFLRFMTTSAANCAPSTKTTAFLINSSVCGMGQTGKKGPAAGEPSKGWPSPGGGPGWFMVSACQSQVPRPGRDSLGESLDGPGVWPGKKGRM